MADRPLAQLITHPEPELVIAISSPVGSDVDHFEDLFRDRIALYGYKTNVLRLSAIVEQVHTELVGVLLQEGSEYQRIDSRMTAGNTLRQLSGEGDILALYAIAQIRKGRAFDSANRSQPSPQVVHLLRSLKHPAEVEALRRVYGPGFFLIGLHASEDQQLRYLTSRKGMTQPEAHALMERDRSEVDRLGQQNRDTFTLSDIFVDSESEEEEQQLTRFLDMVFGFPYTTPTRDEDAMFLAYGASMRSGQLARQVGAVVVSAKGEVIATGANDVPRFGGGQYRSDDGEADRRDHKLGFDANDREIDRIVSNIIERVKKVDARIDEGQLRAALKESPIDDLTEYGRPVHAEMEALMSCARIGASTVDATLYTTTFPCHNCAKHIVDSGIQKVVYVEPYPKSKAGVLHEDSIAINEPQAQNKVRFIPFVGVAARRYFDLFSMRLGDGLVMKRKIDGSVIPWSPRGARPRLRMSPYSYLEREHIATNELEKQVEAVQKAARDGTTGVQQYY